MSVSTANLIRGEYAKQEIKMIKIVKEILTKCSKPDRNEFD